MRKRVVLRFVGTLPALLAALAVAAGCDRAAAPEKGVVDAISVAGGTAGLAVSRPSRVQVADQALAAAPSVAPAMARVGAAGQAGAAGVDAALAINPIPGADDAGPMLVREGQASIEVKRLSDGVTSLRQTATQLGGFVANTTMSSGNDTRHTATLQVRLPTGKFDQLLSALSTLGKVEMVAAQVEDVGGEYVDLQAREENARHMEARLQEMLEKRTGKLSEALAVEQELGRVRGEIERYDARLKWLARRAALSSLDVTIHEPLPLLDREPGRGPLAQAFAQAWERAVGVVAFCIAALGVLVPVAVLISAAVLLWRRLLRPGAPGVTGA